jgi:hypothetical protein
MVQLIPNNYNPTQNEIDAFIQHAVSNDRGSELKRIKREIECKRGVGALLHPAEEYFLERVCRIN